MTFLLKDIMYLKRDKGCFILFLCVLKLAAFVLFLGVEKRVRLRAVDNLFHKKVAVCLQVDKAERKLPLTRRVFLFCLGLLNFFLTLGLVFILILDCNFLRALAFISFLDFCIRTLFLLSNEIKDLNVFLRL